MNSNDHRKQKSQPAPQLARKCYCVESSSDSDSSSLLVLSPARKPKVLTTDCEINMGPDKPKNLEKGKRKDEIAAMVDTSATTEKNKNKKFITRAATNFFSFSESDSDSELDELLAKKTSALGKHTAVNQQCSMRKSKPVETVAQRRKREVQAQKLRDKKAREDKRKEAKEKAERLKHEEKMKKKRKTEEYYQTIGKYSREEIAVLLDSMLYHDDPYGLVGFLSTDFLVHNFPSQLQTSNLPTRVKAIQFIRKDKLQGGAEDSVRCLESDREKGNLKNDNIEGKGRYEHMEYLAVVFEPDDFIPLLRRDAREEEDDYPALESWLCELRSQWKRVWFSSKNPPEPNIIFLLYDLPAALDKKWLEYRRDKSSSRRKECSLPTVKELRDATQWLLVQFQVECIMCPNIEFFQSTVHKMVRGLSDRPYINQVTELECIKKIKQTSTETDDPVEIAKDTWSRMLQQIPGLSETRAQHIVEHFPTCQSLWQAYQWEHYHRNEKHYEADINVESADDACVSLLEDKFSNNSRQQKKLSEIVYRVLTSDDPDEMIL